MKYISENTDYRLQNTAVSLGKFDGIHQGHRLLIEKILEEKKQGYQAVVFTFSLHPMSLFSDKELELIDTEEEKRDKLEKLGIDVLISYPFTKATARTKPEEFVRDVLVKKLDAKVIVVGSDYRFGKDRAGDVNLLRKLAVEYSYKLIVFDKLKIQDHMVSSTLIREEITLGHMETVNELLGEPFVIEEKVITGNQLGRTIGVPTINQLVPKGKIMPPNGVYAAKIQIKDEFFYGVTNVGTKPTVSNQKVKGVETYIFDFSGNLYDEMVSVYLYKFIRPERKFDSFELLAEQIQVDSTRVREYFEL